MLCRTAFRRHAGRGGTSFETALSITGLFALAATLGPAGMLPWPAGATAQISVRTERVALPVTVLDKHGHFVAGLRADSFQVFENGQRENITNFSQEDVPVTVGLLIDHSGSMREKLPQISAAAVAFARTSNPNDNLFVVDFNEIVSLKLPANVSFTSDPKALEMAVSGVSTGGETALYDAIVDALDHLKLSPDQKQALIIVTDGGDNASRHRFGEVLDLVSKSKAEIYAVGLTNPYDEDWNPRVLKQLATVSGGKAYFPKSTAEVSSICELVARNLREQYVLTYEPAPTGPGSSWRSIRVMASSPKRGKLRVRTRAGYMMPSPENSQITKPQGAQ
jgi:Ca-activated chloride channel homolog